MEQSDLMRKYPPTYVAERLLERLPTNLCDFLTMNPKPECVLPDPARSDFLVTAYSTIIAFAIADKNGDCWDTITKYDIFDLTLPLPHDDRRKMPKIFSANPIIFAGLRMAFSLYFVLQGYFKEIPGTERYLPTDRFFGYLLEKHTIGPIG